MLLRFGHMTWPLFSDSHGPGSDHESLLIPKTQSISLALLYLNRHMKSMFASILSAPTKVTSFPLLLPTGYGVGVCSVTSAVPLTVGASKTSME